MTGPPSATSAQEKNRRAGTAAATKPVRIERIQACEAGRLLGTSMFDDPLFVYLFLSDAKRAPARLWLVSAVTRYGHLFGEVHTTAGEVEGVAIWLPPYNVQLSAMRLLRVGMLVAPLKLGLSTFTYYMSVFNHLEKLHRSDVPARHWYLLFLGVDPLRQGRGIGSSLIQAILSRADAGGLPAYVESTNSKNVPFYLRHGFEVVVDDDFTRGGPHFWTMKRQPQR